MWNNAWLLVGHVEDRWIVCIFLGMNQGTLLMVQKNKVLPVIYAKSLETWHVFHISTGFCSVSSINTDGHFLKWKRWVNPQKQQIEQKKQKSLLQNKARGFTINSFHSLQTTLLNHLAFWRYDWTQKKYSKRPNLSSYLEGFTLQKIRVQTCNWRSTNVHPWKLTWHDWLENPLTFNRKYVDSFMVDFTAWTIRWFSGG